MHIAIAGNIGSGKTTLTGLLSKHYKWEAQFEDVLENPYLEDFYNKMARWSFNLQIYFLNNRFRNTSPLIQICLIPNPTELVQLLSLAHLKLFLFVHPLTIQW